MMAHNEKRKPCEHVEGSFCPEHEKISSRSVMGHTVIAIVAWGLPFILSFLIGYLVWIFTDVQTLRANTKLSLKNIELKTTTIEINLKNFLEKNGYRYQEPSK